jgi:hypothetical protein
MASTQVHEQATTNNGVRPDLRDRSVGSSSAPDQAGFELARDEVESQGRAHRQGKAAGVGGGMFGAAGIVVLLALGALTAAAILGLATVIDHAWIAALIVGAAVPGGGRILALMGKEEHSSGQLR